MGRSRRARGGTRGFTLVELVVVLAILGLLLALAVPRYLGARKRAYKAEIHNILQEAKTLSWAYYHEHDFFPVAISDIALQMPGGAVWTTPVLTSGGGSSAFIQWTSSGTGAGPIPPTDACSITLSSNGDASQACTF